MAKRSRDDEKKVIDGLPDEFKILKHDLMDYCFLKSQSDYYFGILLDIDIKKKQKPVEELFKEGVFIKMRADKQRASKYFPTPPTFMFFIEDVGIEIIKKHKLAISKLEKIYFDKYCNSKDSFLNKKRTYFTGRGDFFKGFIIFLVKMLVKKEVFWTNGNLRYEFLKCALEKDVMKRISVVLPEKVENDFKEVSVVDEISLGNERMIIIDDKYFLNFFSLNNSDFTGYITTCKEEVSKARKRFKRIGKF